MKLDLNTSASEKIYILGAGAIGMALAVNLLRNGRSVAAVRTSNSNYSGEAGQVSVECDQSLTIEVRKWCRFPSLIAWAPEQLSSRPKPLRIVSLPLNSEIRNPVVRSSSCKMESEWNPHLSK